MSEPKDDDDDKDSAVIIRPTAFLARAGDGADEPPPAAEGRPIFTECCRGQAHYDLDARTLQCGKCGKPIDPITFIGNLSRHWHRIYWSTTHARRELEHLKNEIDGLKRARANLRAQMKRANRKQGGGA